jgi:alcohol dehydrogenase class IV
MSYELRFPGETVFGEHTFAGLAARLPAAGGVLIVGGRHAESRARELQAQLTGRRTAVRCDVTPELPLADVDRLIEAGRAIDAAVVVAIGGGSAIDAGKVTAALLPLAGSCADYFYHRRQIPGKGAFFAAVPTTAGTGAEATPNAVLSDPATGLKQSIRHPGMMPDLALVDPVLTWGCPHAVTAASGFDALTQAVEAGISRRANPVSFQLALTACRLLAAQLPGALRDEPAARAHVAEASMICGLAFAQSGLGAVHGIAHPLGSLLHIPHGVACAILLPAVLRFNAAHLSDFAAAAGYRDAATLIKATIELRRKLELPENFKRWGLSAAHHDFIVANCRSGSMKSNPAELSDADVIAILEELS